MPQSKHKKTVLFVGIAEYDLRKEDRSTEKKFSALSRGVNSIVLARGQGFGVNAYGARFYVLPYFGKWFLPIWHIEQFFIGWWLVLTKKVDVIITQSPSFDGVVGGLLQLVTRKEFIVEVHGDWIDGPFYYHSIPWARLVRKILVMCGRFSLRRADKIRVISNATEKLARQYSGEKPYYRFAAHMDLDLYSKESGGTYGEYFVFVGWLYRLKGVQFLITAFSALQKAFPDFRLVVVGDGPYRGELEELARKLSAKVEFVGKKTSAEVIDIVKHSRALILPSLSEGLGRVLIEAGMLSKPVIGSNVGGIPDVIRDGENGYLFGVGDTVALQEKLRLLCESKEHSAKLGKRGRELAQETYSMERYTLSYMQMIND